ncbi:hypothetical protein [uncultured Mucilaginibacter sp.]|uniref:HYC_CC_PP family protein n=1 Tax=uncultured Mucilaginibacter sp. TaxID=797541 RepID=UPI0025FE6C63|nr:hypothetical protein [uncultured Mucilaginibacter sp.]
MFKRTGAFSLAILYTITVLGFALNLHYCGNKVAKVKLSAATAPVTEKKADMNCGMKMDCCKNHKVDVKVKDTHQQAEQTSFLAKIFAFEMPKLPFEDFIFSAQKALLEKFYDRGPPEDEPKSKVATFIQNCNFRI